MHDTAFALMQRELDKLPFTSAQVLDVGSFDVNGSLRQSIEQRGWTYTGLDVRLGPNVDVIARDPSRFPLAHSSFDVVVSVCGLHNVAQPWRLFPEMARVLKPDGVLIAHAVWSWGKNEHPQDYFRIMPDGMLELFSLCDGLEHCRAAIENDHDVIGVATKKVYT